MLKVTGDGLSKICISRYYKVNNILLLSEIPVLWGHDSILTADMLCQKQLYTKFSGWTALVNIAGSEYPVQDNLGRLLIM